MTWEVLRSFEVPKKIKKRLWYNSLEMEVSRNGGTPKWMIYYGKSQTKMGDDWGYPHDYGNLQILKLTWPYLLSTEFIHRHAAFELDNRLRWDITSFSDIHRGLHQC